MKNAMKFLAAVSLATLVVCGASAQAKHPAKHKMAGHKMASHAMMMKCPVCHMTLASRRSKMRPVEVRLKKGGMAMYCCKMCKMPASVLVKSHKMAKKGHTVKHMMKKGHMMKGNMVKHTMAKKG